MRIFKKGHAGRGLLYLLSGSVAGQIVLLVILPILSRIYTPEQFGVFTLTLALAGVVAPAATLRFESAAMLPTENKSVIALTWLSTFALIVVVLITLGLIHLFKAVMVPEAKEYPYLAFWVSLFILLIAAFNLLNQLALRKQKYALVAQRSFYQSLFTAGGQVGFGFASIGTGLLCGALIGRAVGLAVLFREVRDYFRKFTLNDLKISLQQYWRFPVFFAPSALLNSLGLQAPLIFLTLFAGSELGGQLGMAEKIIMAPVLLLGNAVGQVINAEVSKHIREKRKTLLSIYLSVSGGLGLVAILIVAVGTLIGPILIPRILGEEWEMTGILVQILAYTSAARLMATPANKYLLLLQKSIANTILDLTRVLLLTVAILSVLHFEIPFVSATFYIYSGLTLTYVFTWIYGAFLAKKHDG